MKANRALWQGPARRMLLFKWFLCAALLSEMAMSPWLWVASRRFPTVPMLAFVPDLPQVPTLLLSCLLVWSVLLVALSPRPRLYIYLFLAVGVVLVVFDIDRLQPWFYQYLLAFGALALMDWTEPESPRSKAAWAASCLIPACIYFWSGLQKANFIFATVIFPWLLHPLGLDHLSGLWFLAPLFETSIGLLLIVPRTRTLGLLGSATMHGFILLVLGPLYMNYNSIVWPWSFWMVAMEIVLFWRTTEPLFRLSWSYGLSRGVAFLIGVMPVLNYADLWDGFLSASFYSGRLRDGWLYVSNRGAEQLPEAYRGTLVRETDEYYRLDITQWAIIEMNVPPYAQERVYLDIARKLERDGVDPGQMVLYVRDRQAPWSRSNTFSEVPIPSYAKTFVRTSPRPTR